MPGPPYISPASRNGYAAPCNAIAFAPRPADDGHGAGLAGARLPGGSLGQQLFHPRHDLFAVEADSGHQLLMVQCARTVLEFEAVYAKRTHRVRDLHGHRLGRSDVERSPIGLRLEAATV